MNKKFLLLFFSLLLTFMTVVKVQAQGGIITPTQPAVGNGSAESPYEIGTAAELYWLANQVNRYSSNSFYTKLVADITVNTGVLAADGSLNGDGSNFIKWTPIGTNAYPYQGTFDGQNHTISGLYVDSSSDFQGLFGICAQRSSKPCEAKVCNVILKDSYIKGRKYVGGICGLLGDPYYGEYTLFNTISNCRNAATVKATSTYCGGICGKVRGTTKSSIASSSIVNCANSGLINTASDGGFYTGGVCGQAEDSVTICNNYNTGNVIVESSRNSLSGMIVGSTFSSAEVYNCYYLPGSLRGIGSGSGLVYEKTQEQFNSGEVCYLLNGAKTEGNLVWKQHLGQDLLPVLDGTEYVYPVFSGHCALQGYTNNFDEIGTKTEHIYENGICRDCNAYEPADLSASGVYEIGNVGQLYWFASLVNGTLFGTTLQDKDASACLTADIAVNENVLTSDGALNGDGSNFRSWTPIGSLDMKYSGNFDGQNHTISGLYLNNTNNNQGFIGYYTKSVSSSKNRICNLVLKDSYIKGSEKVGGICGYSSGGQISRCGNFATVGGSDYVGGICGDFYGSTAIMSDCYNMGSIGLRIGNHVGGLCGQLSASAIIERSFSMVTIFPAADASYKGILCGYAQNSYDFFRHCYYLPQNSYEPVGSLYTVSPEGKIDSRTVAQFSSGEVCWQLNGFVPEGTPIWGQAVGTDAYPNYAGPVVYPVYTGCALARYTNNADETNQPSLHQYNTDGFCTVCDAYEPAALDTQGVYEISNAGQLYWFAGLVNGTLLPEVAQNTKANARLTKNIIVNTGVLTADGALNKAHASSFRSWPVISSYTGTFDGRGYTVSGLYCNSSKELCGSLFRSLGNGGKISRVGVIDSYFNGYNYRAGICGSNSGIIEACYSTASVTGGSMWEGGICASNNGTISQCYFSGHMMLEGESGGICGTNISGGIIRHCYYLEGSASIGIKKMPDISKRTESLSITKFASGEACYLLNASTSAGETSLWGQIIVGVNKQDYPIPCGTMVYATYGGTCRPQSYSNDPSTADTPSPHHYENGFCTSCDRYEVPEFNEQAQAYDINNAGKLYWFASLVNGTLTDGTAQDKDACAQLTADIVVNKNVLTSEGVLNGDGSGFRTWMPIGNYNVYFNGNFNGQGHTVSGLYTNTQEHSVGLLGEITGCSTISRVGVIDSYFKGGLWVGGICGFITSGYGCTDRGSISACYSNVFVDGIDNIGGICGDTYGGIVRGCYSNSKIAGTVSNGGAICGKNRGTVAYCYYLNGTAYGGIGGKDIMGVAESRTAKQFASGEVCWLLNGATTEGEDLLWGQTLGAEGDAYPVLGSTSKVYAAYNGFCCLQYSNSPFQEPDTEGGHTYENGFCTVCGTTLPAVYNETDNIYEISNAGQLYWFAALVNGQLADVSMNSAANARLMNDITVNSNVLSADDTLNVASESMFRPWTPIGRDGDSKYAGVFDGQGYDIVGLYFNGMSGYMGLFGYISGATIRNVGLVGSYFGVEGLGVSSPYVGGICGYIGSNGTIITCCYSRAVLELKGTGGYIGGICGMLYNNSITSCYATGLIKSNKSANIGGICGYTNKGTFRDCYYLEGIASGGVQGKDIYNSVRAKSADAFTSGEVTYLLNQSVNGVTDALLWGQILAGEEKQDIPVIGGTTIYAAYNGSCCHQYSNTEFTGPDVDVRGEHLYENGYCLVCGEIQPATYVEAEDVYEISNAGQLYWFSRLVNGGLVVSDNIAKQAAAKARLTADVIVNRDVLTIEGTLNGDGAAFTPWEPIGMDYSNPYTGVFDGQGHAIKGLYLSDKSRSNIGLFGYVRSNAIIRNMTLADSFFEGEGNVGGLCGYMTSSSLLASRSSASVGGTRNVGGLCGYVGSSCTISSCYNTGLVTGEVNVGALVGYSSIYISRCYFLKGTATGAVGSGTNLSGAEKEVAAFANGEVCYLLNGTSSGDLAWGQTLNGASTDAYPVPYADGKRVYRVTLQQGRLQTSIMKYYCNNPMMLQEPTFENGYTVAWYDGTSSDATLYTSGIISLTADLTLYARYTANSYQVHYLSNYEGSSQTMEPQDFIYNKTQALIPNVFTRVGYNFAGWNTDATGTGITYANNERVTNLTAEANGVVQLYAQWTPKKFTVILGVDASQSQMGTVYINDESTGAAGSFDFGSTITLYAAPAGNYYFQSWSDGNTDNPRSYILATESAVNLSATFAGIYANVYCGSNDVTEVVIRKDGTGLSEALADGTNAIALINDGEVSVPEGLSNVLVKATDGTYTCDNLLLTDQQPFYSPVDFTATNAVYRRDLPSVYADGTNGWETLIVPFNGILTTEEANGTWTDKFPFVSADDVDGTYWLKTFDGMANSSVLGFGFSANILANTPYILALPGDRWGEEHSFVGKALSVRATGVTVKASASSYTASSGEYSFVGSYTGVNTVGTSYFLNSTGNLFERMSSTISVAPFRCFVQTTASPAMAPRVLSIGSGNATNLDYVTVGQKGLNVYELQGRIVVETEYKMIVRVRDLSGVAFWNGEMEAGRHYIDVPATGVYLVNDLKVMINK